MAALFLGASETPGGFNAHGYTIWSLGHRAGDRRRGTSGLQVRNAGAFLPRQIIPSGSGCRVQTAAYGLHEMVLNSSFSPLLWVLVRFGTCLVRDRGKCKWCGVNRASLSPVSPSHGAEGKSLRAGAGLCSAGGSAAAVGSGKHRPPFSH